MNVSHPSLTRERRVELLRRAHEARNAREALQRVLEEEVAQEREEVASLHAKESRMVESVQFVEAYAKKLMQGRRATSQRALPIGADMPSPSSPANLCDWSSDRAWEEVHYALYLALCRQHLCIGCCGIDHHANVGIGVAVAEEEGCPHADMQAYLASPAPGLPPCDISRAVQYLHPSSSSRSALASHLRDMEHMLACAESLLTDEDEYELVAQWTREEASQCLREEASGLYGEFSAEVATKQCLELQFLTSRALERGASLQRAALARQEYAQYGELLREATNYLIGLLYSKCRQAEYEHRHAILRSEQRMHDTLSTSFQLMRDSMLLDNVLDLMKKGELPYGDDVPTVAAPPVSTDVLQRVRDVLQRHQDRGSSLVKAADSIDEMRRDVLHMVRYHQRDAGGHSISGSGHPSHLDIVAEDSFVAPLQDSILFLNYELMELAEDMDALTDGTTDRRCRELQNALHSLQALRLSSPHAAATETLDNASLSDLHTGCNGGTNTMAQCIEDMTRAVQRSKDVLVQLRKGEATNQQCDLLRQQCAEAALQILDANDVIGSLYFLVHLSHGRPLLDLIGRPLSNGSWDGLYNIQAHVQLCEGRPGKTDAVAVASFSGRASATEQHISTETVAIPPSKGANIDQAHTNGNFHYPKTDEKINFHFFSLRLIRHIMQLLGSLPLGRVQLVSTNDNSKKPATDLPL